MEDTSHRYVLGLALLASLCVHAALIFTVEFDFSAPPESFPVLNLRLVKPFIEDPVDLVDTPVVVPPLSDEHDESIAIESPLLEIDTPVITSLIQEPVETVPPEPQISEIVQDDPSEEPPPLSPHEITRSILDWTGARLAQSEQDRIRTFSDEGALSIEEALYLQSWLRKVHRIGQLNYPQEAKEKKLYGTLSIYVSIAPDGSLVETRIVESSGHEILDNAALRIVKLAAPFAPFPQFMRNTTDLLEIVRTWEFRKHGTSAE